MYILRMDEVTWSYVVFLLAALPWLAYAMAMSFILMSIVYGRVKLHRRSDSAALMGDLPGITVVKPLMGIDPKLEQNLESHFTIKYPKYELLLCVQDENDPVIDLVYQFQKRYPSIDSRLILGGTPGILNPMVQNMAPGYDQAKHDIIWVSTSRIWASTEILMDMVAKIQKNPKVALVHQMPFTVDVKGVAGAVEKIYFGATIARYYLAFNMLGINCITGMSYLIRKSELDDLNGLGWFGRFLAEDFFIAKLLHEKGFRHQVAAVPAQQNVSNASIRLYKDRMVRWLRLRLNMMPFTAAVLEPLGESVPLGLYLSWSLYHFFSISPFITMGAHVTIWCFLDYIQLRGVQNGPLSFGILTYVVAWLIREILYVYVYFSAIINVRRIKWGRKTYFLSNFGETLDVVADKAVLAL